MTLPRQKTDSMLAELFQRLSPRLMAAGRRLLGNRDDASDAMQETFIKLWSRNPDATEGTVITAMRNTCIDTLRSRRQSEPIDKLSDIDTAGSQDNAAMDLYDDVSRIIDSCLSERDRMILLMRDRDGFEFDAISARTGLSEGNIRLIISRARHTVRRIYLDNIRNQH